MATKYCPQCRAVQPEDADFCGSCGNAFPPPDRPKPADDKKILPWIAAGIVIVLFLVLGGWLVFRFGPEVAEAVAELIQTSTPAPVVPTKEPTIPPATATPTEDADNTPSPGEDPEPDATPSEKITPRSTITPIPTVADTPAPELTDTPEPTATDTPSPPEEVHWSAPVKALIGSAADGGYMEIATSRVHIPEDHVIVGIAGRVNDNVFKTLLVQIATLMRGGEVDYTRKRDVRLGSEPDALLEAGVLDLPEQFVVVGLGMHVGRSGDATDSNIESMVVYSRFLDPQTGTLSGEIVRGIGGSDHNPANLELDCYPDANDLHSILVGFAAAVGNNQITGAELEFGSLVNERDSVRPAPDIVKDNCG